MIEHHVMCVCQSLGYVALHNAVDDGHGTCKLILVTRLIRLTPSRLERLDC